jgi:UDP-2,3-diacylglucosamine pyrophosphatase LpxH
VHILISDLHLGKGDDLDDFLLGFKGDNSTIPKCVREMDQKFGQFIKFLNRLERPSDPVKLILLGDIFDLIQVAGHEGPGKLDAVRKAHQEFFQHMDGFTGNHSVMYVVGNHDAEMLHPAMTGWLKKTLPNLQLDSKDLPFRWYQENELYCEHGNQLEGPPHYNVISQIYRDFSTQPFSAADYPPGSKFVLSCVNDLESRYPDVDNILGDRRAATTYYLVTTKTATVFRTFLDRLRKLKGKLRIASASPEDDALFLLSQLTGRLPDRADVKTDDTAQKLHDVLQTYVGSKPGVESASIQAADGAYELLKGNADWLRGQMQRWARNVDENAARFVHDPGAPSGLLYQPDPTRIRFIVCGHTHRAKTTWSQDKQRAYFNTGTWRHFYDPSTKAYSQKLHYVLVSGGKAELHHFD